SQKYGIRDHRGGGRSSARETVCRVAAGAIAKLLIKEYNITIHAGVTQVGPIKTEKNIVDLQWDHVENNIVRCPDPDVINEMTNYIRHCKESGDTTGGQISCIIRNCPVGLGEPVFDKLHADLGKAMLSINAVKGFEYGSGFDAISMKGSEHNDIWESDGISMKTKTNYSGGIQGGISNGMPVYFNVAFKPVATIMKTQSSVTTSGDSIQLEGKGRHDPCVVPRAVPIVEAMAALVIADHLLRGRGAQLHA
ncbi:MAG: chorismate synthase, partial [Saprospiraceae bacterium]|nr:chorismate synthase [Saprospiraceae bacterium]